MKKRRTEQLVPLLIDVQRKLDQSIDLESLAARFGASPFHFHRVFADTIGETPKKHVERLRLERAAFMIAVTDTPLLDIALNVGFKNPETFSRNFKKFLGYSPSGYRRMAKAAQAERVRNVDFHASDEYLLSRARFQKLPAMQLLALRHMGSYGELHETFERDDHLWNQLIRWAQQRKVPFKPMPIGIYYDDPTVTPPSLQRSDLCIPVERAIPGTENIRCIAFDGGMYGIVEYVGRPATILNGFRGLADEIRRSSSYDFREGPPPLEFLKATNVGGQVGVHSFEFGFAVQKRRVRRKNRQERDDRAA